MTDHRARIERLTRNLLALDERIAAHEAAAASTTAPLSRQFTAKLDDAHKEHRLLTEHIKQLEFDQATHWNKSDPVAAGMLQGLLESCDALGARIDAALARHK